MKRDRMTARRRRQRKRRAKSIRHAIAAILPRNRRIKQFRVFPSSDLEAVETGTGRPCDDQTTSCAIAVSGLTFRFRGTMLKQKFINPKGIETVETN
ncbi:hypothetical protein KH017_15960 [bacterium]|nr:hypothetical protein [bacterium]